jgi:chloramphenicol O-acetyltransferase
MEIYIKSIIPLKDYIFGSFRFPECLVSSTIMPEQISILDKRLDSPILYDNSEELYVNNIIESYKEEHGDFQDVLLYSFYSKLAEQKNFEMIVDNDNKIAIILDKEKDKSISIKIPDLTKY